MARAARDGVRGGLDRGIRDGRGPGPLAGYNSGPVIIGDEDGNDARAVSGAAQTAAGTRQTAGETGLGTVEFVGAWIPRTPPTEPSWRQSAPWRGGFTTVKVCRVPDA